MSWPLSRSTSAEFFSVALPFSGCGFQRRWFHRPVGQFFRRRFESSTPLRRRIFGEILAACEFPLSSCRPGIASARQQGSISSPPSAKIEPFRSFTVPFVCQPELFRSFTGPFIFWPELFHFLKDPSSSSSKPFDYCSFCIHSVSFGLKLFRSFTFQFIFWPEPFHSLTIPFPSGTVPFNS